MLYLIVFSCGAALMSLEIVAARVLAPALGTSVYVWGAVISTVMTALALGYWLGGHAADRYGPHRILPPVIAGAAVTTVAAPILAEVVLPWVSDLGPRVGSLTAATLIFFIPGLLLAMVSPLGVRIAASRGMSHIGRSAGGLYAVSTGGSIIGTLATSFWLVPALSVEPLLVWTGLLLAATSIIALVLPAAAPVAGDSVPLPRKTASTAGITLGLIVAGAATSVWVLTSVAPPPEVNQFGETVLYQQDSQYHRIFVTEDDAARHLRFDNSHQSAIALDDPFESRIAYPDYMHLSVALVPQPERVLVLGLGGGAITKRMWRDYPGVTVDSVEIDPTVVDVARDYFALPEDERSRVYVEDARRFVQTTTNTYDIIIIDAYYSDSLPYHLTTQEFLAEVRDVLSDDGVVAYNVISTPQGDGSDLFRSMYRTADTVWENLWAFPIGLAEDGDLSKRRNIIVLATDRDVTTRDLLQSIEGRVGDIVTVPGYETFGQDLYTSVVRLSDVPILTDSHAPTDALIEVQ